MNRMTKIGFAVLFSLIFISSCLAKPADSIEKVKPKVAIKAHSFDLTEVRLLDGPFKDAMELNRKYLHDIDADRMLHNFRVNAGLPSSAKPFGGWEDPNGELRGHSMGHYLSGCALMYASTGDTVLKEKAVKMAAELAKCQKALGQSGYLSAYPESFIDRVENRERVWAPYYTLHKIFAGLIDVYTYCGDKQALDVAVGMARWCKSRCDKLSPEQMEAMLNATEQGGMNEALSNLYALTGEQWIFDLARRFDEKAYTEPLYEHKDNMTGQHVNSFIPNIVGTAREYELTGNQKEHEIAVYFWDQVANHRSYATGGTSNSEAWLVKADILSTQLGNNAHESCCTYNILKLTRHLFTWEPKAETADFYERGIYNGILSTIEPKTGMTMYYVPMQPGAYKTFGTPFNSFWCCTGSGMENHAKYGESIYYHDDKSIYVNLFIASELNWKEKGITIRQETKFPQEDTTSLTIKTQKPVELTFNIRVPYWAAKGIKVAVNGKAESITGKPASYASLKRTWKNGDKIDIQLPMSLHLCPTPDNKNVFAIMYGPVVLAGDLGPAPEQTGSYSPTEPVDVVVPAFIGTDGIDISKCIEQGKDPLTFKTVNAKPNDVSLIPFYKLFGRRYTVYWKSYPTEDVLTKEQANALQDAKRREEQRKIREALRARTVDSLRIANENSEKAHQLEGDKMEKGTYDNRRWIQANPGGWFSLKMNVLPDKPVVLMCSYWGADTGDREFDILVDGTKIANQKIHELSPGQFVDIEYPIPQEITKDKEKVTVKFQPHPDNTAGGIFGISILRPKDN